MYNSHRKINPLPDGSGWGLSVAPGAAGEKHQNGENLQTACQHGPGQHQLAEIAVSAEVAGGAHGLQTGTDVIEGTQHRGEIGSHRESVQGDDDEHREEDDHIGGKVGIGVGKNLFVHNLAVGQLLPGADGIAVANLPRGDSYQIRHLVQQAFNTETGEPPKNKIAQTV